MLSLGLAVVLSIIAPIREGIAQQGEPKAPGFWVRPGYQVSLVASDLEEARFLEIDDKGILYVSQPGKGQIVTYKRDGERYRRLGAFVTDKRTVHGMCWHKGWMWFSQTGSISKARDTNGDGVSDEVVNVIPEGQLPRGGGHWWRSLLVTDDYLYTSIGDSGNITDEVTTERQKIYRFKLDGSDKTLFSSGLRNTEKLRLRPGTQEVWGVDHGSDWFGGPLGDKNGRQPITDFNPPDEVNRYVLGGFYGHPFIVGNRVPRIEYQKREDILDLAEKTISPEWCLPAHVAPNSMTFLTKNLFPNHQGDAVIASHGSWNNSKLVGYEVGRLLFDTVLGHPYGYLTIVKAISKDGQVLARPVDCVEEPNGTILFSCDQTRRIYRISPARTR